MKVYNRVYQKLFLLAVCCFLGFMPLGVTKTQAATQVVSGVGAGNEIPQETQAVQDDGSIMFFMMGGMMLIILFVVVTAVSTSVSTAVVADIDEM